MNSMEGPIGHEHVIRFFSQQQKSGRLAHAYLFQGPLSVGKTTLLFRLAEPLLGAERVLLEKGLHPDFSLHDPDWQEKSDSIAIDTIREIERKAQLKPVQSAYTVIAIAHLDRCTNEAANALLKILEEPPHDTVFLLTTEYPERLPATLRSRTQRFYCAPVAHDAIEALLQARGVPATRARRCAVLACGAPGIALRCAENTDEEDRVVSVVRQWLDLFSRPTSIFQQTDLLEAEKQTIRSFLLLGHTILHDMLRFLIQKESRFLATIWDEKERKNILDRYAPATLAAISTRITEALRLLQTNASPKLILENLFLSF